MSTEEYITRKRQIEDEMRAQLRKLKKEYAESNNPFKVGDVITDHIGSGRIRSWIIEQNNHFPTLIYRCDNLTKKGTINKREPIRSIYAGNIIK